MKGQNVVFLLTSLFALTQCRGRVINTPPSSPMLGKMDEITRHLQDLTRSMAELDRDLEKAVLADGAKEGIVKRDDASDFYCRLHLHEDTCQMQEYLQQSSDSSYLDSPLSPGKRSGEGSAATNYRKLARDLKKKRQTLHTLRDVFNNAAYIMEREKKWLTCNLNLGFTCQTQEYSNIADYYDFLNSADSPGKKRAAADPVASKS